MARVHIGDYFKFKGLKSYSAHDLKRIERIRTKINSFEDEADIEKYLFERRQSSYFRQEDERLFGIPTSSTIDIDNSIHRKNKFYKPSNKPSIDYYKRDKNGNIKRDRYGNAKEYKGLRRKGINFANNIKNTKIAKIIKFIIKNIKIILIASLICSLIIGLINLTLFLSGMFGAIGHTPFIVCGDGEYVGAGGNLNINFDQSKIDEYSKVDYVKKCVVALGKARGWTKQATVGTLSYIIQEGGGMGFFTYESYWCVKGPGGSVNDTTIGNDKWETWLNSDSAHSESISVNPKYYSSSHFAIGIGLLADSDVWDNGSKTCTNASDLLARANEQGKYWQDPQFQLDFVAEIIEGNAKGTSSDSDWKDPKTFTGDMREYAKRVTCFYGMQGYRWTDGYQWIEDHAAHVPEAEEAWNNFDPSDSDIGTFGAATTTGNKNLCDQNGLILTGGNETLADTAVTLASGIEKIVFSGEHSSSNPQLKDSRLKTYVSIHDQVLPGDEYYASCDRGVATAVRWSGIDDDFPAGATDTQWSYMKNSDKWKSKGMWTSMDMLEPGDVIVTAGGGHIIMYVGNEAVKKRFPDADSNVCFYAASLGDYYPHVYAEYSPQSGKEVFKCIKPDTNSKYKDCKVS